MSSIPKPFNEEGIKKMIERRMITCIHHRGTKHGTCWKGHDYKLMIEYPEEVKDDPTQLKTQMTCTGGQYAKVGCLDKQCMTEEEARDDVKRIEDGLIAEYKERHNL